MLQISYLLVLNLEHSCEIMLKITPGHAAPKTADSVPPTASTAKKHTRVKNGPSLLFAELCWWGLMWSITLTHLHAEITHAFHEGVSASKQLALTVRTPLMCFLNARELLKESFEKLIGHHFGATPRNRITEEDQKLNLWNMTKLAKG